MLSGCPGGSGMVVRHARPGFFLWAGKHGVVGAVQCRSPVSLALRLSIRALPVLPALSAHPRGG
jgi:hypothetical protein